MWGVAGPESRWKAGGGVRAGHPLLVATALMVTAMWLSKTLQPLWFDGRGDLPNFGVSTTAMAVAGLSAFWAHRIVGPRSIPAVLAASCALYGVGMALRVFTGSALVAVVSGAIAGFGASTFLAAVRIDVARQPQQRQRTAATRREGAVQVGTVAGTLLASVVLATAGRALWIGLLAAPVLLVLAAVAAGRVPGRRTTDGAAEAEGAVATADRTAAVGDGAEADGAAADRAAGPAVATERPAAAGPTRRARARVVGVWAARGFGASLVIPYVPLLLAGHGVARGAIGVVLAAAALGRLLALRAVPAVDRRVGSRTAAGGSELLLAVLTLALVPALGPVLVVVVVLLRSAVITLATVTQDLVLFTMGSSASLVGVAQASFLVGDAGAGLVAPHLWSGSGDAALVAAAAIAVLTAVANNARILPPALAGDAAAR